MTTALTIIDRGFREGNLVPIGETPSDAERAEGLDVLNGYLNALFGYELGELFVMDWPIPPSRTSPVSSQYPLLPFNTDLPADVWPYPPQNVRLLTKISAAQTIYFPSDPSDGARIALVDVGSTADLTISGNGRLIEGSASLTLTPADDAPRTWFYRADLASWQRLTPIADNSEDVPLPDAFDDMLSTGIAIRLSGRNEEDVPAEVLSTNSKGLRLLKARYRQKMPQPSDFDPRLFTQQSFDTGVGDDLL